MRRAYHRQPLGQLTAGTSPPSPVFDVVLLGVITAARMESWQLGLRVHHELVDALKDLLRSRSHRIYVEESDASAESVLLIADIAGDMDPAIPDAVGAWLLNLNAPESKIFTRCAGDESWKEGWKAILASFQASDRVWVVPSWAEAPEAASVKVVLESSLAFGIGGHPTTRAALQVLDNVLALDASVRSILDVGAGSGILALAAGHLGVSALGIEPDNEAFQESLRNLQRNDLSNRVAFRHGMLKEVTARFDLVVANLYPATLSHESSQLMCRTKKHLIVGGFTAVESPAIRALFPNFVCNETHAVDDWAVLHLVKRNAA